MTRIDQRLESLRLAEETRRAEQARRAEEAAQRAAELAAELPKALESASASDTARVMAEANRLPQQAQRSLFGNGEGQALRDAVEGARRSISERFPEGDKRLALGTELAPRLGLDAKGMSRTALEALATKAIARLGHLLAPSLTKSAMAQDGVERRPHMGPFAPGPSGSVAPDAAAVLLSPPVLTPTERPWSERPPVARRVDGPMEPAMAPAAELDRQRLREAFGLAKPARKVAKRVALAAKELPAVQAMSWSQNARFVAAPALARLRERLAEVGQRTGAAREALAHPPNDLRVIYGAVKADGLLAKVEARVKAVQEKVAREVVPAERSRYFTGIDAAQDDLGTAREYIGEARTSLEEVAQRGGERIRTALGEVQGIENAAAAASGELALAEGQGRVLDEMAEAPPALAEGEAAGPPAEGQTLFTEDDLKKIGTGLDPKARPPQTYWTESMVNTLSEQARTQGGLSEEQAATNAETAKLLFSQAQEKVELSPADVAAALKQAGIALEKVDPNQLASAARYVSDGTSAADQQERLRKTLDNFQALQTSGSPKLSRQQTIEYLWAAAKVPGHALTKLSDSELQKKFQEVLGALNGPAGKTEIKLGKHRLKLTMGENGEVKKTETKKKGFFGSLWDGMKKVAKVVTPIALTVMSFIPVTAPFALAANAAISLYKAVKAKSLLGIVAAGAGLVGAGVGAFAASAMKVAGSVANRVATIANATSRTLYAVQAARQGSVLGAVAGVAGAVASGVSSVAGSFGQRFTNIAERISKTATRLSTGAMAIDAAKRGDLLGAAGLGASLAADFNFTGPKTDSILKQIGTGTVYANNAQRAIRQGDYLAAAASATALASRVAGRNLGQDDPKAFQGSHTKLAEDLLKAANTLSMAGAAQTAIKSRDYFTAAQALTRAAALHTKGDTQKTMLDTADRLHMAGKAFDSARKGDYLGAAGQLTHLVNTFNWDADTKKHLTQAADVFRGGSGIHASLKTGDYVSAASHLAQAASVFGGESKQDLLNASVYLAQAAPAYAAIRRGDYATAAGVLTQMAVQHNLIPGQGKKLDDTANVLERIAAAQKAIATGDYATAAALLESAAGLGVQAQAAVAGTASALAALGGVQAALRDNDLAGALQAGDLLVRQLRPPSPLLTSALGRLQRVAGTGNQQLIQLEVDTFSSVLASLRPQIDASLRTLAQNETRDMFGSQAQAMAAGAPTLATPATAAGAPASAAQTYTVQRGDTLSALARRFGTTVADLVQANPEITNPDLIHAGQNLRIPRRGFAVPAPAQPAQTPVPTAAAPGAGSQTYAVQRGDTLGAIAMRFGTTVADIVRLNPEISNPDRISAGQTLRLPVGTATPGAAPTASPAPATGAIKAAADEVVKLLDGWTFNAEEQRILDIIKQVPDAQINEFLGELKARGRAEKLFSDLHGEEYGELLRVLAAKGGRADLDEDTLDRILQGVGSGFAGFGRGLAQGLVGLLRKETWTGMWDLGTTLWAADPRGIVAIVAPRKHAEAVAKLNAMVGAVKKQFEDDWNAAKAQGKEAEIISRWSTQGVLEIASCFIGAGVIKKGVDGIRVGAKLAEIATAVNRVLGLVDKVGDWSRALAALRRAHPERAEEWIAILQKLKAAPDEALLKQLSMGDIDDIERVLKAELTASRVPQFATTPMRAGFQGEHLPGNPIWENSTVRYLSEAERQAFRLHIKDGKLYDANGRLFDTSRAFSAHGGQGRAIFVMDESGNIYASTYQKVGEFHHSSLLAGGRVAAAGELEVQNGVLRLVSNRSGHYRPPPELVEQMMRWLEQQGVQTGGVAKDLLK